MDKLPKPLVALINSVIDDYEQFSWNSNYLGDKMRISLVWTRGDAIQVNRGIKHKSRSNRERDNKRIKILKERIDNSEDDVDKTSDINIDNSEVVMDSGDDMVHDGTIDLPLVAPENINITPVVKVVQPVCVSIDETINLKDNVLTESIVCQGSRTVRNLHTDVKEKVNKEIDKIKTIAPKLIITGKSPCTDSHFQKIVYSQRSDGSCLIGKLKKREMVVIWTLGKRGEFRHVNLETEKIEYENAMSYVYKFRDIRKSDNDEIKCYVRAIPRIERYAEMHKLCLWCFDE
ncbi:Hypothetical predicted protein [Mytilus galloprovincialis]|uniref:Uncharacterized protein n=1 Tax=Mytilus galloprovincialis TaxID=29158 RepID=A0A8B6FHG3_MYTGA|nr:Hypothetical predicted protein [Mytilus galloprovincialis]